MTGLVADVGEWRPQPKKRRLPSAKMLLLIIVLAAAIGGPSGYLAAHSPAVQENTSAPPPTGHEPGRHLITLNVTNRADTPTSTFYIFEDYPAFAQVRAQYGATSGMLIHDCSGPAGVITLRENNSKLIERFFWEGQPLIAMNSWHSWSYWGNQLKNESWGWWENATMDWQAGTWRPSDGVLVEHQLNQTFGDAQIDVLYFVPQPIPEFSTVIVPMTFIILMILIARRRRCQEVH